MPLLCDTSLLNDENVVYRNYASRFRRLKAKLVAVVFLCALVGSIVAFGIYFYKRSTQNDKPSQHLAIDKPSQHLAIDKPSQHLATDKPSQHLAIDKPSQHLATDKPSQHLATDKPSQHLATDKPSQHLAIDQYIPAWALKLMKSMDTNTSPCTNFFDYACGGWATDTMIPPSMTSYDRFNELSRNNMKDIKTKIEQNDIHGSAEKKASSFYRSCMSVTRSSRYKIIDNIKRFLGKISNNEYKTNYNTAPFRKVISEINIYDVWPLMSLLSRPDPRNSSKQILTMFHGKSSFELEHAKMTNQRFQRGRFETYHTPKDIYKTLHSMEEPIDKALFDRAKSVFNEHMSDINGEVPEFMEEGSTEIGDASKYTTNEILKIHTAFNKLIFKYFWDASTDNGMPSSLCMYMECPKSEAQKMAENLLDLEVDILQASVSHTKTGYTGYEYKVLTVQELQQNCDIMDWRLYFKELGVLETEEIVVLERDNIFAVCRVVKHAQGIYSSRKKILQNFLLVQMVKSIVNYYAIDLLIDNWETKDENEYNAGRWYDCILQTNEAFGLATSAIFMRGTSYQDHIKKVQDIMRYVKESFRTKTLRQSWLDSKTQMAAVKKLNNMIDKIGYPHYVKDMEFVDEYYKTTEATDDFLKNMLASKSFKTLKMTTMIMEPSDRNWWNLYPDVTNAVHAPWLNDMTVPVGIMSFPFFDPDRPMALNFGAMGSVIGHEMTHAFDTSGQYFNYEGVLSDWMTNATEKQFMSRARCFTKQYNDYYVSGYKISGNLTLNENIADNGGMQTSFHAFDLWRKDNPNGTSTNSTSWMDKFQMTDEKLFFLGFSQMHCSKYTENGLKALSSLKHSPGPLRVKGTLSNFDTFGEAYHCKRNRYPCKLW